MTESNWQGDMLRRLAEQSPAEETDRPATPPAPAPGPAPAGPPQGPPQYPNQPPQQYQQQPQQYQPQPQQYPAQQYQGQPYQGQQYQGEYPQQYSGQQPYPPQGYPQQQGYQQPQYQPGPYDQQYAPPPYQPSAQQPYPQQQQPYPQQQYPQEQYPPQGQQNPGQVPYQEYYDQPPQQPTGGSWSTPPTPQSDQLGTPLQEPDGDSVFRRFRRIASEAAYLVGGSGRMRRDVNHIATIRRPIAIMRRIGVLSPVTNAGTSTVSALLSTMLSTQRADRVVVVDADPAGAELSRRLEFTFGAGPVEGVTLVRSEATAAAIRSTLAEVQGQGARDVGLAVVDCPGSMYDEVGSEMASSGHCAVLVVPSAQQVAEYCLAQLDQLPPEGQNVLLNRGVVVISMVENAHRSSVDWLVEAFARRGLEPVVLPYDAHIVTGWPLQSEQLQSETREAVLELAARVVATVTKAAS
jgi:MinD-like ATPase involved in chromosome partitioning or flagellar assembly